MRPNSLKSFTLVELLIVIAILAVLAAAVVLVLNPAELIAQSRDTQRISDVNMVKKAVDLFILDNSTVSLGTSQKIYISLPDTSATCANITGLPVLPAGWSYNCVVAANLRNINGTGWIPLDFTQVKGGSPIPYLPIDPQNDQTLTKYYQYIPDSTTFELTTLMESEKQSKAAAKDGGIDPGRLEVGSSVSLWKTAMGMAAYWDFEEGSGTSLSDKSGNSNNGTWSGTGTYYTTGKVGGFSGIFNSPNYVDIPDSPTLNSANALSLVAWVKLSNSSLTGYVITKNTLDSTDLQYDILHYGTGEYDINMGINNSAARCGSSNNVMTDSNRWYHIATVFDGAKIYLYVDGQQVGLCNYSTPITQTTHTVNIGRRKPNDVFLQGNVDELMVLNRALTAKEVQAIYNSGK